MSIECDNKIKELVDTYGLLCVSESLQKIIVVRQNKTMGMFTRGIAYNPTYDLFDNNVGYEFDCLSDPGIVSMDKTPYFYSDKKALCGSSTNFDFDFENYPITFYDPKRNYINSLKHKHRDLGVGLTKFVQLKEAERNTMFVSLLSFSNEKDCEIMKLNYNQFRINKRLPAIELVLGDEYYIRIGKKESRIVKMTLQKVDNINSSFPQLYFLSNKSRVLNHNIGENISLFKVINKVDKNAQNKN